MLREFLQDPRNLALYRSYWMHTVVQLVIIFTFLGWNGMMLFAQYTAFLLMFMIFQFPLTTLIIIMVDKWTQKVAYNQGLNFKIIFSTGIFVIIASIIIFLFLFVFFTYVVNAPMAESGKLFSFLLSILGTYIVPTLFLGEVLRQRMVVKKIYPEHFKK